MITVQMEERDILDLLIQRINCWTDNPVIGKLYVDMYERLLEDGCFNDAHLDIKGIVDNDYVNYCSILDSTDPDFDKYVQIYKERGPCDISDDGLQHSYIEAVDDDDEPTMMLVRA